MAVAFIQEFPAGARSTTNYDFIREKVGDVPFDGLIAHTAGFDDDDGVFRVIDIWETQEQAQRFLYEHIQPLVEEGPSAFPSPETVSEPTKDSFYELHDVLVGARVHAQISS